MTNIRMQVRRGVLWKNVEIEDLTDKERSEFLASKSNAELVKYIDTFCLVINLVRMKIDQIINTLQK